VTLARPKRVHLAAAILEERRACESCWLDLPIGAVVIAFDGAFDFTRAAIFCVRCVTGASIEAAGLGRYQHRAQPVTIRIRSKLDGHAIQTFKIAGGCAVVRSRLPALTKNLDLDLVRVDLSDLEAREASRFRPRRKGS
jgi:hypothetical protein